MEPPDADNTLLCQQSGEVVKVATGCTSKLKKYINHEVTAIYRSTIMQSRITKA